jgi:uncharacterized coiled-coil DUF342 family protein
MLSTGLDSEAQAGAIFAAIKAAAGSDDYTSPITFAEFTQSIMDFPQLLQQFKDDFETLSPAKVDRQNLTIHIEELSESDTSACNSSRRQPYVGCLTFESESSDTADQMRLPIRDGGCSQKSWQRRKEASRKDNACDEDERLADVLEILGIAQQSGLKKFDSAPEPDSADRELRTTVDEESLLGQVEDSLNKLQRSLKDVQDPVQSCKLYAVQLVVSAFKILHSSYQGTSRQVSVLSKEVEDWRSSYETTYSQLQATEDEVSRLQHSLEQTDNEFTRRQAEAESIRRQNYKLESELLEVRQAEEQTSKEVSSIQVEIKEKEKCIKQLSLELRRLNSMKTIHEMKHKDFTPETISRCRQSRMTPRKSVPHHPMFSVHSPLSSPVSKAFCFEGKTEGNLISEQRKRLKSQATSLRSKQTELDERELKLRLIEENLKKRHDAQIKALIEECETLKSKVIQLEAKNLKLLAQNADPSETSETGPTLFSELLESGGLDTRTSIKSARMSRANYDNMRELLKKQAEAELELANSKSRSRCCSFW